MRKFLLLILLASAATPVDRGGKPVRGSVRAGAAAVPFGGAPTTTPNTSLTGREVEVGPTTTPSSRVEGVEAAGVVVEDVDDDPRYSFVKRNIYEDVFLGSADLTKFLAVRMEEYRGFYDAIGLGKPKARSR